MKNTCKIFTLLLAVLLCGTLFPSCGNAADSSSDTVPSAEPPATETVPEWALPDMDLGGESVTFLQARKNTS